MRGRGRKEKKTKRKRVGSKRKKRKKKKKKPNKVTRVIDNIQKQNKNGYGIAYSKPHVAFNCS